MRTLAWHCAHDSKILLVNEVTRILSEIESGDDGMGVIYLASQKVPVRGNVALKVIKAGMDTEQVVARFEAERQAMAMMNHHNIAKGLDAGATDAGRPYFVMELGHERRSWASCPMNATGLVP
ncbi:MAG: hypothetical protein ABL921_07605 [Pirellula sp.]